MPIKQFVGNIDLSGNVTLRSNSILWLGNHNQTSRHSNDAAQNYNITTKEIRIYDHKKLKTTFNNVSIKNLWLTGDYNVTLISKDLNLPYMTSRHDYLGLLMPKFNMTINLSDNPLSSAQIVIPNQKNQSIDTISMNKGSEIQFNNVQGMVSIGVPTATSMPVRTPILLKSPEVDVDGNATFTTLRFSWHYLEKVPTEAHRLKTTLSFIDVYSEPYENGTRVGYITFMNSTNKVQ
jgi:hypothetical protein